MEERALSFVLSSLSFFLEPWDVGACSRVCKRWKRVFDGEEAWKNQITRIACWRPDITYPKLVPNETLKNRFKRRYLCIKAAKFLLIFNGQIHTANLSDKTVSVAMGCAALLGITYPFSIIFPGSDNVSIQSNTRMRNCGTLLSRIGFKRAAESSFTECSISPDVTPVPDKTFKTRELEYYLVHGIFRIPKDVRVLHGFRSSDAAANGAKVIIEGDGMILADYHRVDDGWANIDVSRFKDVVLRVYCEHLDRITIEYSV